MRIGTSSGVARLDTEPRPPHFGNKLEYKSERDKDREYYEEKLKELEDD